MKYLHAAREEGGAKPIYSSPGGIIRGWAPGSVEVMESLGEKDARRAAAAVVEMFDGKPVFAAAVGRHFGVLKAPVARWLKIAEKTKLAVSVPQRGWEPVEARIG